MDQKRSLPRRVGGIVLILVLAGGAVAGYFYRNVIIWGLWQIRVPGVYVATQGVLKKDLSPDDFKVMATGLKVPWALGFLPDGSILVTERQGTLKRIAPGGGTTEVKGLDGTHATGEGGLLGLAVHPQFDQNHWIYLYQTADTASGLRNRVLRFTLVNDALTERTTVVQNIPAAAEHDGGALGFGPDGKLYVGTGDAGVGNSAQDMNSLAGKILRVNDDASTPTDNPYPGSAVWSLGHRNVEGFAWDDHKRLWATEHGRSGLQTGFDELNIIEPGANYGWPVIEGDEKSDGMRQAAVHSGPTEPWAPAGAAVYEQSLLFGGLRGEALYQARISSPTVTVKAHFENDFGRIRAVVMGPDQKIYFTTSNTDGRGLPRPDDDKVIRLDPSKLR